MSYTQWVSNGTNVSYVPKEKDTGEVITPFTTTAPGGVPNSSYAPSTYVLAASGAWIPQTVGTSSSEVRRPTAYTLLTSNPSPYFEATDTSLVYDSDTNHLTTNGRFVLQGLIAQNDASFKFSSFQTKAQTWTSATLNISRNYASTRWTSGTEARYYLSTDGGTNWTLLLTDDYDNDPVTVTIFSHTLATSNPSSLSNYQVKVEIDAFSSGALGSVGVLDLQLYDIWIEGIYTVSGGSGTVTSITTTGSNGITISGGSTQTITTSGTFALALGNITPTSISTGTGSFSGDVEFAASIKSPNGSNSPVTIAPDGTGDLHVNADSLRLGDNNANATIATNGTGDLILTTHEGSATEGVIRLYDGANGNITLTPNGTGQVQVGSDQVVTLTASQTLTNKTLSTSSTWNGNTIGVAYGGTGSTTLTSGSYVVGNGTSAVTLKTPTQVTADLDTFTYQIGATAGKKGLVPAAPAIGASVVYLDQTGSWTTPSGSGTTTNALTIQSPLTGTSFNGSTAVTIGLGTVAVGNGGTGLTTLTAGYIPYGNGTSAFGSSANLFWDSTNSRLGIGTSSPRAKLETSGSIFATSRSIPTGGAGPEIWWSGTVSGISSYDRTNSAYKPLLLEAEYSYFTTANGSEQMRINNTGVGIGKTPSYKLDVNGTINGTTFYSNGYTLAQQSSSYIQLFRQDGGIGIFLGGADPANYYDNTTHIFRDRSSGEYARINSTGLGIGTTNPVYKVQIEPTTVTAGGVNNLLRIGSQSTTAGTTSRFTMFCSTDPVNDTNGGKVFIDAIRTATNMDLAFSLNNTGGAAPVERMRLTGEGNLGIGTSSPSTKLQVNSSGITPLNLVGSTACQINLNDGTQNANWGLGVGGVGITGIASPSTYPLVMYTNGSERMRIDSNGNVGIGTSTVLANFGGYKTLELNGTTGGLLSLDSNGTNNLQMYTNGSTVNVVTIGALPLTFGTNSTERMRIDSSGNLLVGRTTTPADGLARIAVLNTTDTAIQLTKSGVVSCRVTAISTALAFGVDGSDGSTERMRIDSSQVKATVPFIGNSGTKGFGAVTTTTSTSTPTGGSSGDHYYIY